MLKPLNGRVLIIPDEAEKTTSGGILLLDNAVEKPMTGVVCRDVVADGQTLLSEGSRVVFSRYGFDEIEQDGTTYYLVSKDSILATFL